MREVRRLSVEKSGSDSAHAEVAVLIKVSVTDEYQRNAAVNQWQMQPQGQREC